MTRVPKSVASPLNSYGCSGVICKMAEISDHLAFKLRWEKSLLTGSRGIKDFDINVIPNCNLLITLEAFMLLMAFCPKGK